MNSDLPRQHPRVLVVGLGNADRGDDAAGCLAARELGAAPPEGVRVLVASGEGAALIDSWKGASSVILIAAIYSCEAPGSICRIDARSQPVSVSFPKCSTRAFGLAETVELARALNQLPPRLVLFGIVGKSFESGAGLSAAVEAAVQEVTQRVRREIGCGVEDGAAPGDAPGRSCINP